MKIFVWKSKYMASIGDGIIISFGETIENARSCAIRNIFGYDGFSSFGKLRAEKSVERDISKDPFCIPEFPCAIGIVGPGEC